MLFAAIHALFVSLAVTATVKAAPQPVPAGTALKQTSRSEILRRMHEAPRRRNSGLTYPHCEHESESIQAAQYAGRTASGPLIRSESSTDLQACIQSCVDTANCESGYFEDSGFGSGTCHLLSTSLPDLDDEDVHSTAFVLHTDCAANAEHAPALAQCCNY